MSWLWYWDEDDGFRMTYDVDDHVASIPHAYAIAIDVEHSSAEHAFRLQPFCL
ncbi:MAG TPA: hypothetical protein VH138_05135 [Vicinamibacterales bacterium]|nr:hypothetical protein [Vicinamibacterales bacterium]